MAHYRNESWPKAIVKCVCRLFGNRCGGSSRWLAWRQPHGSRLTWRNALAGRLAATAARRGGVLAALAAAMLRKRRRISLKRRGRGWR